MGVRVFLLGDEFVRGGIADACLDHFFKPGCMLLKEGSSFIMCIGPEDNF
jgi:uncharacterized protein (UPF0179 family)